MSNTVLNRIFLIMILVLPCTAGFSNEKEAENIHLQGIELYRQSNFQEALEKFTKAVKLAPENPRYLNDTATTFMQLGEFQQAVNYLNRTLDIEEKLPKEKQTELGVHYNNLAQCWYYLGEHKQAIKFYQRAIDGTKALEGNPSIDAKDNQRVLAAMYSNLGNYEPLRKSSRGLSKSAGYCRQSRWRIQL